MTVPVSAINNDKELADFINEHILDEGLDPQQLAVLMSMAKNRIETNEKPTILIAEDLTKTRASGDSYLSMKALPDDFRQMLELYVGTVLYKPVPFRKRFTYRNTGLSYYIDYKNSQFAICGSAGGSDTIRQVYLTKTADFTESSVVDEDATTCVWPKEYWPLIAFEVAEMITMGTDVGVDDISARMNAGQREIRDRMLQAFRNWDQDLKLAEMDGRTGYADEADDQDLTRDILPYM